MHPSALAGAERQATSKNPSPRRTHEDRMAEMAEHKNSFCVYRGACVGRGHVGRSRWTTPSARLQAPSSFAAARVRRGSYIFLQDSRRNCRKRGAAAGGAAAPATANGKRPMLWVHPTWAGRFTRGRAEWGPPILPTEKRDPVASTGKPTCDMSNRRPAASLYSKPSCRPALSQTGHQQQRVVERGRGRPVDVGGCLLLHGQAEQAAYLPSSCHHPFSRPLSVTRRRAIHLSYDIRQRFSAAAEQPPGSVLRAHTGAHNLFSC